MHGVRLRTLSNQERISKVAEVPLVPFETNWYGRVTDSEAVTHGQTFDRRCLMGADRAVVAEAAASRLQEHGRVPDRAALTGILFVLRTGIRWQMLPKEVGCGSGSTCWRRLVRWQRAGGARTPCCLRKMPAAAH